MRLSDSTVEKLLTKADKLPGDLLTELKTEVEKTGRALQDVAMKREIVTDEDLTKMYA